MHSLKTKLEATKSKLQNQDFTSLTKDDILGDLLFATALAYFAEIDVMNFVITKRNGIVNVRLPSESIFSHVLKTKYTFDIPISVSAGGMMMDVDRDVSVTKAMDGDKNKVVQFMITSGMNGSSLEHSVPEQMLSTTDNPAEGISAVKALQIANDQGIPIYTVSQSNINTVLPQLQIDADVKADIQNAVNAGKEVTVSKTNINFNGWTGCGYIIIDPLTGVGAYMISGGMSGAIIIGTLLIILAGVLLILAVVVAPETGGVGSVILAYFGIVNALGAIAALYGKEKLNEFMECIGEIIAVHIAIDSILSMAESLIKGLVKKVIHGIATGYHVYQFGKCIKESFY
jgi:hypothetical protein